MLSGSGTNSGEDECSLALAAFFVSRDGLSLAPLCFGPKKLFAEISLPLRLVILRGNASEPGRTALDMFDTYGASLSEDELSAVVVTVKLPDVLGALRICPASAEDRLDG